MPRGPADLKYDPETGVYWIPDVHETPGAVSTVVVTAVAAIRDTPVAGLEPLTTRLDPDALDGLFAPHTDGTRRCGGMLTFRFADCAVTVESEGEVRIDPGEDAESDPPPEAEPVPEPDRRAEDA